MIITIYILMGILLSSISSRFIFGGDSAEFSAIAHTWSIPHPPGYPFYSFLVNCITHIIPFGTIPWRASLLSVIPTVLTAYLLFKICTHLKVRKTISLFASLLYIILFPVWEYALVPEVFALNSFLVMGITYFLFCYQDSKRQFYIWLSAFFVGLCIAHHHIFVIFVPGWVLLLKSHFQTIWKVRKSRIIILTSFLLGLSFYLYAPVASYFNPPIQWEDAKTVLGFWRLITRAVYGTFTVYGGPRGDIRNQLYDVLSSFIFVFQDFRIIGIVLIGVGVWFTLKNKNKFFQFLFLTSFIHIFFLFYTNFTLSTSFTLGMYERFLISFYAILVIYFTLGFEYISKKITQLISRYSKKQSLQIITNVCLLLFFIIYTCILAKTNYKTLVYIKDGKDFDRLGKDLINTAPPGNIFYARNDNANFALMYQVFGEKYKSNSIFFQINFLNQKYYIEQFKKNNKSLLFPKSLHDEKGLEQFIKLNKNRGVYLETPLSFGFWMPYGLLWKYYANQQIAVADLPNLVRENHRLWESIYHIPVLDKNTRNLLHLQTIQDFYVDSYITYAKLLYYANENIQAEGVLKTVLEKYRPSSDNAKITLMNLLLVKNSCNEAKKYAKNVMAVPIDSLKSEFVTPLMNYYSLCDPLSKNLLLLKEKMKGIKQDSLTPLNSF